MAIIHCFVLWLSCGSAAVAVAGFPQLADLLNVSKKDMNDPKQMSIERDKAYRSVLTSLERFEAIRQQQPTNVAALERCQQDLQQKLDDLHKAAGAKPLLNEQAAGASKKAGSAPPAGPVSPSKTPSSLEEAAKRKKATEEGTYLPGRNLEGQSPANKSLAGVGDEWVRSQCEKADANLFELGKRLKADMPDPKAIAELLIQARDIIDRIRTPPQGPAPTTPQGARIGKQ